MKKNLPVTDREITFDKELISKTDLKGSIKGFNEAFQQVSGFETTELMDSSHNIIRHPDMPPAAFEDMWTALKAGKHWMGMVKNRTKTGDFYWVDAYVTPIFEKNTIVGYESVRAKPSQQMIKRAELIYKRINDGKSAASNSLLRLSIKSKSLMSMFLMLFITLISQNVLNSFVPGYISSVIAFVLGGISYFLLKRFIFRSLDQAVAKAKAEIDNPLMALMYSGNSDEIGQLTLVSEMLKARLRTVLTIMEDTSHQIQIEATQTYKSQNTIANSMKSQAEQIDQVATAMTEMSASIQEVALNASGAATKASEVDDLSQQASTLSTIAREGLVEMDKVFDEIIEMINELNTNTKSITPMIGVIANVAEQTNLLALNAAIEAARAGEHGRGFAVVAEEVRNLASRTQASTVEISELIKKLDNAMEKTISGTNRLKNTADSSSDNVEKSIDSASAIADKIRQLNELVILIATAVEEQSAVSEDINKNVVKISTDAESVAASSSATSVNAQNLAEESNNLTSMVRRFRSQ